MQRGGTAATGIVHCRHSVNNEFDQASDIARWHVVRAVPSFLLFRQGALVDRITLPDSRSGVVAGVPQLVRLPAPLTCSACTVFACVARTDQISVLSSTPSTTASATTSVHMSQHMHESPFPTLLQLSIS